MLIIAERAVHGSISSKDKEILDEMQEDLTKVIEDFMRAIDVEALRLAKKSGEHSLS